MSIPTVKCSICGNEVTKRRSLAMPDGTRACETHPEAQTAADAKRKQVVADLNKKPERRKPWGDPYAEYDSKGNLELMMTARCFTCRTPGIRQDEFMTRVLIAHQKMEMKGSSTIPWKVENGDIVSDPEYAKALRENMLPPGTSEDEAKIIHTCLSYVDCKTNPTVNRHLHANARFAVDIAGFALICPACMKKYGAKQERPQLTLEQMNNWATVAQMMKPTLEEMAKKEMEPA